MTTPQPLKEKDHINFFARTVDVPDVWLAAQWALQESKKKNIEVQERVKESAKYQSGFAYGMNYALAMLEEAFGACRPETDFEKALSEAKERIKRQEVKR